MVLRANWQEIKDEQRRRLWCRIDPARCLLEIVNRGEVKIVDLTEYGLIYIGTAPESAEKEIDDERHEATEVPELRGERL